MANTINISGSALNSKTINISGLDANWAWDDSFDGDKGLPVLFIEFVPGAADDECVIRNGEENTDAICFHATAADADDQRKIEFYGNWIKPRIVVADGTYSAGAMVIIQLGNIKMESFRRWPLTELESESS